MKFLFNVFAGVIGALIPFFALMAFLMAVAYGYIMNIVTLLTVPDMLMPEFLVRVIGLFAAPIGVIAGYF
jgi:hypothetical protein